MTNPPAPSAAPIRSPQREASRHKRRQLVICLLLSVIVMAAYPKWRDFLAAKVSEERLTAGSVLIASPVPAGRLFRRSEVLILNHNERGTRGIVLGVPYTEGLSRLPKLSEAQRTALLADANPTDFWGGPVALDKVFVSPGSGLLFRGYAGWGPGQLKAEIRAGRWQVPVDPTGILAKHGIRLNTNPPTPANPTSAANSTPP